MEKDDNKSSFKGSRDARIKIIQKWDKNSSKRHAHRNDAYLDEQKETNNYNPTHISNGRSSYRREKEFS